MSDWVLIIFMFAGSFDGGAAIEQVQFNTQAECLAAAILVEEVSAPGAMGRTKTIRARCLRR